MPIWIPFNSFTNLVKTNTMNTWNFLNTKKNHYTYQYVLCWKNLYLFSFILCSVIPFLKDFNVEFGQICTTAYLLFLKKFPCSIIEQIFCLWQFRLCWISGEKKIKSKILSNSVKFCQIHEKKHLKNCVKSHRRFQWLTRRSELFSIHN